MICNCKRNQDYFRVFLCNVLLLSSLLVFGGQSFSIDSWVIEYKSFDGQFEWFISSYRFVMACIVRLYCLIGYDPIRDATPAICFYIISVSGSITWLTMQIADRFRCERILCIDLAVSVSVLNVWFCDILSFPECIPGLAVGVSFAFVSLGLALRDGLKNKIFSGVLLVLASGVFQQFFSLWGAYAFALCLCLLFTNKYRTGKERIREPSEIVLIWVISGAVYYISASLVSNLMGLVVNERAVFDPWASVRTVLRFMRNIHSWIKGRGCFDTEVMTVLFGLMLVVWCVMMFRRVYRSAHKTADVIFIVVSMVSVLLASLSAAIIAGNSGIRAMFPFFAMYGVFLLTALAAGDKFGCTVLAGLLAMVIAVNMITTIDYEIALKRTNAVDLLWGKQVLAEIERYETETDNTVQRLYIYHDEIPDIASDSGVYAESATTEMYACRALLNMLAVDRDFTIDEMSDEDAQSLYKGENWDCYIPSEQIRFVNDTAYICCYY